MSTLDQMIIGCALLALVVFIVSHVVVVRCSTDDKLFNAIQKEFIVGACVLIAVVLAQPLGVGEKAFVFLLSFGVYGLASFFYVLCLFGPYATSIRMRLIHELDVPEGKSRVMISRSYNDHMILGVRLKRLLSAGDIRLSGDQYRIARSHNAFFIIDAIAEKLHALIRSR